MRQSVRRGRDWAVVAGVAVAALVLVGPASEAQAQTFDDTIQRALNGGCDGLNGPKQGNLASICSATGPSGPAGAGSSTGASIATQTARQQGADERL